ncbi:MAG: DNA repair protein RecO [Panacagrimonas sp.]
MFQPLLLSWRESADLGNLNAVEANGAAVALKGEAVFCGWYLNELLLRMLHRHDPQAAVYDLYAESLRRLPQQLEPTLRRFELRLLQALGFGLDFPPALGPDRHYVFTPQLGFVAAAAHSRAVIRGDDIAALRDETLRSPSALQAAKAVLRAALAPHLGGRPLQSAQRLRELRRRVG